MHSGVHWASLKLVQVVAQQAQALICWIIPIEPKASIAWVVVSPMEVLHNSRVPLLTCMAEQCAMCLLRDIALLHLTTFVYTYYSAR